MRSEHGKSIAVFLGLLLGPCLANVATAQAPLPPPAPVPTIWDKLGVGEFDNCFQSKFINANGNHPGLEHKPLLKKIADPANLQSDNPAIKAAAQVKQQEDLAPQKIKAIKYLATMGCGCYQKTVTSAARCWPRWTTAPKRSASRQPPRFTRWRAVSEHLRLHLLQRRDDEQAPGARQRQGRQRLLQGVVRALRQMSQYALDACRQKLPPGYAETPPGTIPPPSTEHPILPPAPSGEHPSGVPSPAPLPPEPQPLPSPSTEPKKPLEVPAEPPHSARAPSPASRPSSTASAASTIAIVDARPVTYEASKVHMVAARVDHAPAPPAARHLAAPKASTVAILDITPVDYEAGKVRTVAARRGPSPARRRAAPRGASFGDPGGQVGGAIRLV